MRLAVIVGIVCAYLFGVYSHKRQLWPLSLRHSKTPYTFDRFGRLTSFPGKREIPCPVAPDYVLLLIGQSNAANSGGQRHQGREGVVNYHDGKCYAAVSPLLGASGVSGEAWTLLGNTLRGTVVLVPAGVGSTSIKQWADGRFLEGIHTPWPITHVLWHQGEEDHALGTMDYADQFAKLLTHLPAPVFVSVATRCGDGPWTSDNPIAQAQRSLPDGVRVFAGPDTDALMTDLDRFEGCHFSASGQEKFAAAWRAILQKNSGRSR